MRAWAESADAFRRKYMEKRFAVLDQNVEAIVRTHLAEDGYAVFFEELARALEEIGEYDAAWEYAKRGTESGSDWQARSCRQYWVDLARNGILSARRTSQSRCLVRGHSLKQCCIQKGFWSSREPAGRT